ncbi:MAG: zinc ribbon domain-containing protein [Oscillospiraceae bacterium]|nr:zinc ribbon domain-containing protein [Oscillospiraceae bacterium]
MGLFDKLIKDAVSGAVGNAVSEAMKQAIQPKADELAQQAVNQAAGALNQAQQASAANAAPAENQNADVQPAGGNAAQMPSKEEMEAALGTLGSLFSGFAAKAAESMKLCPKCGEPAAADKAFCQKCGAKLPDMTIAEGAKCPKCGRQNDPDTKFCAGCGEKLPAALAKEQAAAEADAEVLALWKEKLPDFPVWNCGGTELALEQIPDTDTETWRFSVRLESDAAAQNAVRQYRQLLMQNGFQKEGQYPSDEHLYKRVNGVSMHCDTEHCFEGDADSPDFYFNHSQPYGGYDYKKPESKPKQSGGLLGALFG